MWIWTEGGHTLVNTENVSCFMVADGAVKAYMSDARQGTHWLKTGTEAECKAYLEQLDLDLAKQGELMEIEPLPPFDEWAVRLCAEGAQKIKEMQK